jgi:hypothetical protein
MLLANIVTSIKTKSPINMHKNTINLNIIKYYNYSGIYNSMEIHIPVTVLDISSLYEDFRISKTINLISVVKEKGHRVNKIW